MAKGNNQKLRMLYLMKILSKKTDDFRRGLLRWEGVKIVGTETVLVQMWEAMERLVRQYQSLDK